MGRSCQLCCRSQTKLTAKLPKVLPTTLEWQILQAGSLSSHANHFTTLQHRGQEAKYSSTLFQNKYKTIKEGERCSNQQGYQCWKTESILKRLMVEKREETLSGRGLQWKWLLFCSRHGKSTEGKGGNMGPQHSTVYSLRSAYWTAFPVDPPALPHRQETKAVTVGLGPRVESSASCSAPLLLTQGLSGSSTHIYSSKSAHGTQT